MATTLLTELTQIVDIADGDMLLVSDVSALENERSKRISVQQLKELIAQHTIDATPIGEMTVGGAPQDIEFPVQNEWVKVEYFSADPAFLVDTEFIDNSLKIKSAGTYLFNGNLSGQKPATGSDVYEIAAFLNGDIIHKTRGIREFKRDIGSMGVSGFLDLEENDIIDVRMRNTTDDSKFEITGINFNVSKI